MAAGTTRLADVVVPQIFTPYVQQRTAEKSRLILSGAVVIDPRFTSLLSGGGLTFNEPSFKDLDNDAVLDFDLPQHTVQVRTTADADALLAALDDAGYPATRQ